MTSMATDQARTVHVEHCMGTVFSIDIRDAGSWTGAVTDVVAWLHRVDAVFSTYLEDSQISRIRRSELKVAGADPEVAAVLELCAQVQAETHGWFTAMPAGQLDPTGLVKGWAIERASAILRGHGSRNHSVNGGGDVQLSGESAPGRAWVIGISDPRDSQKILTTVSGRDFAVATSGTAQRGTHLLDPFTGRVVEEWASASVIGPSLTRADAYATAAFVMGEEALRWADGMPGYETLLVAADSSMYASAGWVVQAAGE